MAFFKSKTQPLCRCCGKPIRKHAITVHIKPEQTEYHRNYPGFSRYAYTTEKITSKAGCQKLSNLIVISVKWTRGQRLEKHGFEPVPEDDRIEQFAEWDGETYVDEFFCTGECAKRFAYAMAAKFPTYGLEGWLIARSKQRQTETEKVQTQ